MYKPKNKPHRITANDVHGRTCFYCFKIINYKEETEIPYHRGFPHHIQCIEESKRDPIKTKLVNELMDYYKLHESLADGYAKHVFNAVKGCSIQNYVFDVQYEYMDVYVKTDELVIKIHLSYDMFVEELEVTKIPLRDFMFINRLFD